MTIFKLGVAQQTQPTLSPFRDCEQKTLAFSVFRKEFMAEKIEDVIKERDELKSKNGNNILDESKLFVHNNTSV